MNMKVISRNGRHVAVNLENLNLFTIDETEAEILSLYEAGHEIPSIVSKLGIVEKFCRETVETFCSLPEGVKIVGEEYGTVNQLLLMVALDCNMRCSYCYGDGGTYNRERALMSVETAHKTLEVLSPERMTTIIFFGGEPLLNFPVIKEVAHRVEPGTCAFITNGTIMNDDILECIRTYKMSVAVSIDGPEEVHDASRCYPDGRGTHDRVMETVATLREAGVPISVETTFTKKALKAGYSAKEILEYVYQFSAGINITPVGTVDDPEFKLSSEEVKDFHKQCIDFVLEKVEKGAPIYIPDINGFIYRMASPERVIPHLLCPHYARRATVFPNGDVYPCCLHTGKDYYCGNVFDPGFVREFPENNMRVLSTLLREQLFQSCWFTPLLTRICANDVTLRGDRFSLNEDLMEAYSETVEYFLYRISQVHNWGAFFAALQKKGTIDVT